MGKTGTTSLVVLKDSESTLVDKSTNISLREWDLAEATQYRKGDLKGNGVDRYKKDYCKVVYSSGADSVILNGGVLMARAATTNNKSAVVAGIKGDTVEFRNTASFGIAAGQLTNA